MKLKAIGVAGVAGVAGLVLAVGVGVPVNAQDGGAKAKPSFLFVLEGRDAELTPVKGKPNKFELSVPVKKASNMVTWFTDRPVREAGIMTLDNFIALWQDDARGTFKADPPNVALSFDQKTLIAVMTDPSVVKGGDGNGDGDALQATLTLVNKKDLAALAAGKTSLAPHAQRVSSNTHAKKTSVPLVHLFVDDYVPFNPSLPYCSYFFPNRVPPNCRP